MSHNGLGQLRPSVFDDSWKCGAAKNISYVHVPTELIPFLVA